MDCSVECKLMLL